MKKLIKLLLCAYSLFFVLGSVLAPVCAGIGQYNISAKITYLFSGSCHQKPLNSFWLCGYPMALCCRCTGFYTACFLTFLIYMLKNLRLNIYIFILAMSYAFIDLLLNYIFYINTGRISKFLSGFCMGITFVYIVMYILEKEKKYD